MFPVGYLLDRKSPKTIGFFSCLGWGVATLFTAAVSGFYSFFAVRLLLGATESAGYPTCTRIAAAWTPKHERTTATGVFDCSSKLGSALTPPFVVWAIIHWGWRSSFIVTGLVAMAFAFVWQRYYYDPEKHPTVSKEELDYIRQGQIIDGASQTVKTKEIPMYKLLSYPRIFFMSCGFFLYMYFATAFHMWIPAYLVRAKGFNLKSMGIVATFPFLAAIGGELIGARCLDKWLQRGASLTKVRRTGQLIGGCGPHPGDDRLWVDGIVCCSFALWRPKLGYCVRACSTRPGGYGRSPKWHVWRASCNCCPYLVRTGHPVAVGI
jgi:ACS family glucarate transporter-like MFS transporter